MSALSAEQWISMLEHLQDLEYKNATRGDEVLIDLLFSSVDRLLGS